MYDNMEPIRNTEMHFWMLIKKVIYLHTIFKNLLQVWDSFQWHSGHKHMSKTINSFGNLYQAVHGSLHFCKKYNLYF